MSSPNLPPQDPRFNPMPSASRQDPHSVPYESAFYPQSSEATREVEKQQIFARELLAHTPHAYVYHLIIAANVLVYLAFGFFTKQWVTPGGPEMIAWGADKWEYTTGGQWWRLLTSAFLHFGPIHLFANMYALLIVGNLAERLFGNVYFAVLYLMSALISGLVSVWWDRGPDGVGAVSAGASGAVFAVYGAIIAFVIVRRGSFPKATAMAVLQSAVVFVGVNVVFGLSKSGISNAAHLGGLGSGLVLGAIMARPIERTVRKRQAIWRLAAGATISCIALAIMIVAIPKSGLDMPAELAIERALNIVTKGQDTANSQATALAKKYENAEEKNAEYAAALRTQVIPPWSAALNALITNDTIAAGSRHRALYDLYLEYARTRRDSYVAFADFLESNNPQKHLEYRTLMDRSNAAVKKIKEIMGQ